MSEPDSLDDSDSRVVAVTEYGRATIPKEFREQLGIDAPAKARFRDEPA